MTSVNDRNFRHTPMHQAAYHGRPEMVRTLIELCRRKGVLEQVLNMHSNPAGRGVTGIPLELAEGGGHNECARLIDEAMQSFQGERTERHEGNHETHEDDDWLDEEEGDYSHWE